MKRKIFQSKPLLIITTILVFLVWSLQEVVYGQNIIAVSSQEFFDNYLHLLEDEETIVIDGRTQRMFSGGHLKNAVNIDADDPDLLTLLQQHLNEPQIVVYCTNVRRTIKIVSTLIEIYDGNIIFITDGIKGWKQNGYNFMEFINEDNNSFRKNAFDSIQQTIQLEKL
jgi:rhodanese-related sulfurtransferase